ncbi:hypothetical protein Bhyg_13972 [Pseudolycoriella hygida]|uniref:Uncharacterized protein n=1 Tax=Pseudolycoriella hygida TaxID=35572 RepID=A0A9Q0MP17_9DIPT|nr:hypothetical protein Bhyg_13972 [Pseudolycoriella hygida]
MNAYTVPLRSYTLNRYRPSSAIPRQCETPVLKNGSVRLRQRGRLIRYNCLPSFTLIGDKYSSCNQGQWDNHVPMCITGNNVTFCNGTNWDRSLGTCRETQASPVLICDFEVANICDWEADPTHDFEWVRKNGYTSVKQLQTGPAHDNTNELWI